MDQVVLRCRARPEIYTYDVMYFHLALVENMYARDVYRCLTLEPELIASSLPLASVPSHTKATDASAMQLNIRSTSESVPYTES